MRRVWRRLGRDERGMTTAEYALGTVAACAFAAVLYRIVTSPAVYRLLEQVVVRAVRVL